MYMVVWIAQFDFLFVHIFPYRNALASVVICHYKTSHDHTLFVLAMLCMYIHLGTCTWLESLLAQGWIF